jgi:hypothetical protein
LQLSRKIFQAESRKIVQAKEKQPMQLPSTPSRALMPAGRFTTLLVMVLAVAAPQAHAFFDQPWTTPAEPKAGDMVSLNIREGMCDGIFFRIGYPEITQQGNAIRVLEYGHHWDDETYCIYPVGTFSEPIGRFEAGTYKLTADLIYPDFFGPVVLNIGVVTFTVAALPPAPVPASTLPDLAALGLGLLVIAIYKSGRATK